MFITLTEIRDIIAMTLVIGFIFSKFFKREPSHSYDPLKYYQKQNTLMDQILYGAMIAGPAVVLHELAHKFVAMGFGATATLHAPYIMYAIVVLMMLMNFPIIFLIGGYVETVGVLTALQSALVAIAGPLTNFILWFLFRSSIKYNIAPKKYWRELAMMAKLNLFLAGFNMLPIPGFDGFHFFQALFQTIL